MIHASPNLQTQKLYDDACATPAQKGFGDYNYYYGERSSNSGKNGILDTNKTAKTAVTSNSEQSEDGPAVVRLKKKIMSDIKPIKISKLIDYHRMKDSEMHDADPI